MLPENRRRRAPRTKAPDTSTWSPEMVAARLEEERLNTPVAEMNVSVRTVNALERFGIIVARDLIKQSHAALVGMTNLGERSIEELVVAVRDLGLAVPDWIPLKVKKNASKKLDDIADIWSWAR